MRVNPDVLGVETEQPLPERQPVRCRARRIKESPLIQAVERHERIIAAIKLRT